MALSNIFREPRRELMESAVGYVGIFGLLALDYFLSGWILTIANPKPQDFVFFYGMLMLGIPICSPLLAIILYETFLSFPHFVGEQVCEFLQERGIQLRPRTRIKTDWRDGKIIRKEAW